MISVNKSYIAHDYRTKEADLVYSLRLKDQDVIFYVLMELQSTVDFRMPFRLLSYMMEIWRDVLNNTSESESKKKGFRLPPIVPLVLYNGNEPWTAATCFKDTLDCPQFFDEYLLDFRYFLIDVNRYDQDQLVRLANLVGAIFLLDQEYDIIEIELPNRLRSVQHVIDQLEATHIVLVKRWVKKIVCKKVPAETYNQVVNILEESHPEEVDSVITNIEIALDKARERHIKEGLQQKSREVIFKMLKHNFSDELIADITDTPIDEIRKLRESL